MLPAWECIGNLVAASCTGSLTEYAFFRYGARICNVLFNAEEDGHDYEYQSIENFSVSVAPVPLRYVSKLKESGKIDAEYTQPKYMFELNYTKKGEKSEYTGRHIVTNYYGVKFEVNDEGKVVFDD